ncbi:inactive polyglycylase TTLL10 isoform X3 [Rhinatrema bivittatum]|uniref:inactive polyglycylase TTLL10 isoform X3 n=1 Tax=Rhinatrema bivittatum TaxID=194408 RepID=UPI00112BD6A5|nr:inactive polyglycylase TTLL10 isoform X3 [Rhinatrema bivittatum]
MERVKMAENCSFIVYLEEREHKAAGEGTELESIQEAFCRFRKQRQEALRQLQGSKQSLQRRLQEPDYRWQLRRRFLEQAQSYIGVPYAKKYHEPGTPEYESPLFLDCCGLIRRVLRDLKSEFGFVIGPGNQAYQYDTLPRTVPSEEEMQPGDLVFISGIYFNSQRKKQFHDIVHVEIWLGDGLSSLGARWQKGKVQIFQSYKFVATSYGNMTYHFKSIETWLQGTCVSHCPEHKWGSALALPGKSSIIYSEEEDLEDNAQISPSHPITPMKKEAMTSSQDTEDQREETANNSQGIPVTKAEDIKKSMQETAEEAIRNERAFPSEMEQLARKLHKEESNSAQLQRDSGLSRSERTIEPKTSTKAVPTPSRTSGSKSSSSRMNSKVKANSARCKKILPVTPKEDQQSVDSDSSDSESLEDAKVPERKTSQKMTLDPVHVEEKKQVEPRGPGPFFYIGGKNGAHLVNDYCTSKGWQQLQDRKRDDYKLKWCENKCAATYYCFKAGEQLLYQIPNNNVLTSKIGLLNSLREYERVMNKVYKIHHPRYNLACSVRKAQRTPRLLKLDDFFPETFRLDMKDEREAFFAMYKKDQIWICKPTSLNQGRGIFLLKRQVEVESLRVQLENMEEDMLNRKLPYKLPPARIVQKYIQNPLLLQGKKFDVRSYLLIACTVPYVVFFRHGYVRLTCNNYDPNSDDLTGHLTNQYMQKKHPQYKEMKEDTVWSMERFNMYINEKFVATGLPEDWVLNLFTKRMQQIMMQCFLAVKSKLECKLGYFDLIGCDFLIDEEFKVWVLEMNCNPALHTNCQVLKDIIPSVVNETLDLSLEIFHKSLKGQRVLPLETQRSFVLLYNGEFPEQSLKFTRLKPSVSAPKIQRSSKPEGDIESVLKASKELDRPQKAIVASTRISNATKPNPKRFPQKITLSLPNVQILELKAGSEKFKGRMESPVSNLCMTKKTLPDEPDKDNHAVAVPLLMEQSLPIPHPLRVLRNKSPLTRKGCNTLSALTYQDFTLQLQSRISGVESLDQQRKGRGRGEESEANLHKHI